MITDPQMKKAVDTILDVFGGADGGGDFVRFGAFINSAVKMRETSNAYGVKNASAILELVLKFAKLLEEIRKE